MGRELPGRWRSLMRWAAPEPSADHETVSEGVPAGLCTRPEFYRRREQRPRWRLRLRPQRRPVITMPAIFVDSLGVLPGVRARRESRGADTSDFASPWQPEWSELRIVPAGGGTAP